MELVVKYRVWLLLVTSSSCSGYANVFFFFFRLYLTLRQNEGDDNVSCYSATTIGELLMLLSYLLDSNMAYLAIKCLCTATAHEESCALPS